MDARGMNCMIGYGNARSNLCRVLANMNAQRGGICHIVSPADEDGDSGETNNFRIVKACGAFIHSCARQNAAETVKGVMDKCEGNGLLPYYMYGNADGRGNEAAPVRAYVKVYKEIADQAKAMRLAFDYIFLATGTGMTQAGLLAGKRLYSGNEEIAGISVARSREQETEVIRGYLGAYYKSVGLPFMPLDNVNVIDDFLCGGYGKYSTDILRTIKEMIQTNGIALDPVYTGKAFSGMMDYIKNRKIRDKNILFIHTGSAPLFFDSIAEIL